MADAPSEAPAQILVVVGSLNSGGTERHLLQVLPRLERRRHAPEVFTLQAPGRLADAMRAAGVPVHGPWLAFERVPGLAARGARLVVVALQLWSYLLRRRPRIVHCFLPASYLTAVPLAMLAGIRVRVMSRRSLNRYQAAHPRLAWLERRLHRHVAAVTANSRRVLGELLDEEGVAPERAVLIYNGVASAPAVSPACRGALRARLGLGAQSLVLVIVANLIAYKGHVDLLRACAQAAPELPADWTLLVVGRDDGIGGALAALARELGIADRVRFLGERSDVPELLDAADIALLVSHQEGFSNAVLEAMAHGLPVIVTDVGGNAEAVLHEVTGLVVPPNDPTAIAGALRTLAGDLGARLRLGEAARARAERCFGITAAVDAYSALYGALLAGRALPSVPPGATGGVAGDGTRQS